jgi:predicted DNA-binding protein (UPF0251 family)
LIAATIYYPLALLSQRNPLYESKNLVNKTKSDIQIDRIILAMLEHGTQERAAAELGMSTATICRWSKKPEFQERYLKARSDAYSHAIGRAQYVAPTAVATLLAVIADPKAPPAAKLRAAAAILRGANTFKFEAEKSRLEDLQTKRDQEETEETEEVPCKGPRSSARGGASAAKIEQISLAVLQHGSFSKAAEVCGVSPSTVWRCSQKPEFEEHCRNARYEKYSLAITILHWAANTVMSTLIRMMNHKNIGIRVRAGEMILDLARAGVQQDLQAAFAELESTDPAKSENGNEDATNS